MLISHRHKFIFVHIYKNAGTSVSTALLPFMATKLQRFTSRQLKKIGISYLAQPCSTHATAATISSVIGEEKFKSYFSFCFVRNPWDWQVSLYQYMLKTPNHPQHKLAKEFKSFENYLDWRCTKEVRFQKDFIYSQNGELLVDFVGRFETLDEDFKVVCKRIGIPARLPKLNVSNTVPYQKFYTQKTRDMVEAAFEPDISLFNYSF
ncbi:MULTISPECIES: sulfotransferase family 2 domain-containing protein [Cyanophyceae]|uniref:sulfotransferase family 2 domain-containing protein n=1 Tax=Cyanophyceae TaxID=3028117 RepID=UPI001687FA52|nr:MULTISPECIES: sulfotransferase family 2 domain-containing protein [Cyanophyceae]MBD1916310.1 sulfotransferase family 2 domain-containing protein [Phormidium sp. FACHB-77]MBD2032602.1 sulfotransferase family 2 domain-containing protein [Phormidium sp. FACHB-322]MBD2049974.1 sulfotransferase family 2 domain-containing protein [Leptolyngbya sp. FACHB-60]